MANPTKRTRSVAAAENDENVASSSNASFSSEPQTPRRVLPRGRRTTLGTPSENLPPPSSPTPTRTNTRPLRTRLSLSTPSPSRTPSLTASLFRTPSRSGNGSSASDSVAAIASLRSNGPGSAILTRAASVPTSALALGQIKEAVGGGSAPPPPAKGGSDPDGTPGPSGRGWGKGKENIPPPKDADSPSEGSRKRLRVGRRSSVTPSRARSSSIVSVRSESAGESQLTLVY